MEITDLAKRSSLWTPVSSVQEVGNCDGLGGRYVVGDGEMFVRMDKRWNFVAHATAVDPFSKVAILLSCSEDRFIDLVVGWECFVGDDEGDFDHGLPPCWFGCSANHIVARLLFALWRGWLSLALWEGCCVCCRGFD